MFTYGARVDGDQGWVDIGADKEGLKTGEEGKGMADEDLTIRVLKRFEERSLST